jgi:hypothetical protein
MEATTMSTDTPYSDRWRERTRERMKRLGFDCNGIAEATGIPLAIVLDALYHRDHSASLEVVEPIDELLAARDERREARAIRGELVPVAVDLDALTNLGACVPGEEQLRAGRIVLG